MGSHFLFRARTNIKVEVVKHLKDGSRLVRVPVRKKGQPRVILEWLELWEITVQLHRKGYRPTELRLWTTLLDPTAAPATDLVELYVRRWEHEMCQTQPIKTAWCPLKGLALIMTHLRGRGKRERIENIDLVSGYDHFADQTLDDGLTLFKGELVQVLAQ